ncbi:sulfatase-like hydrolase/transferase [Micromonospora sp. RL09-050-HVF-A]|uniref:sulfatase-like hydrolase/transferase n=1 Tax=Micromonospora sp. RL09-050-HVF-A TaxID=1703433 RepID=UPI001C603046|nr:sulfatase-like hydrolase/transferase [Micromonospora sp. RL09-050-HVF-A]MBW4700718.1 sulfatase-like hydrolase/transferase [Micromonospora sp. RL09-050-HVF-A]
MTEPTLTRTEPVAPPAPDERSAPSTRRVELRRAAELVALVGLVVTQPLLDVLGRSPDFFLFHRAGSGDVLALVALVAVVPGLAVVLLGAATRLAGARVRAGAHTVLVGLLLAGLAVQVGRQVTALRGVPLVVVAVLAGAAGAVAHRRWSLPGRVLRVAAVGPVVFVGLFLFASPASAVVLPRAHEGAAGVAGPGSHPPVVMIVLDELPLVSLLGPDGRIDAARYPNFAELAGGSTWYRNATGVSGWTPYALPAMLTGRYPSTPAAPHYSQYPDNLFTALGGLYDIRAQESITRLCPPSRCDQPVAPEQGLGVLVRESGALLGRIAAPVDSRVDPQESYREQTAAEVGLDAAEPVPADPKFRWDSLNDNQPARFTAFLAGLRPSDRPTLHFLHLLMPHAPWVYLPSGARYDAPDDLPNDGAGWAELARARHLAQLRYTDRLVGETLRTLRASSLYDRSLVVLTADHGVSFAPDWQGRGMGAITHAPGEVAWVPLFVKEPGQHAGRVDDRNWEHVDLLPTIADEVHVRVPWRLDGRSAQQPPRERAEKFFYDQPGERVVLPGGVPARPAPPVPHPLVGTTVGEKPSGGTASVAHLGAFDHVDAGAGELPALVWGTVPGQVPDGTLLAVAVNGRIGAVVPVVHPDRGGRRFAAFLPDDRLFRAGANRLDIYRVGSGGDLRRLTLS